MAKQNDNRPATDGITESDLKMAEGMVKDGVALPPDLKAAYDAHKGITVAGGSSAEDDAAEKDAKAKADQEAADAAAAKAKTDKEAEDARIAAEAGGQAAAASKDEAGGRGTVESPKPRGVQTVPLSKYLDEERLRKEAEAREVALKAQLENLPGKSDEDYEKEVADLATTLGLNVDEVKKLDAFFAKRHQLPADVLAAIQTSKQEKDQKSYWDDQFQKFDDEFVKEMETLKSSDPNEAVLMEQNKAKLKELAFTEGYNTKSTWELWTRFVKPSLEPNRKTVEVPSDGGAGGAAAGTLNWAEVAKDPAKIRALSSEQYAEFDKWMIANSGGAQVRRKKNI